jgi:hypothetical protein
MGKLIHSPAMIRTVLINNNQAMATILRLLMAHKTIISPPLKTDTPTQTRLGRTDRGLKHINNESFKIGKEVLANERVNHND